MERLTLEDGRRARAVARREPQVAWWVWGLVAAGVVAAMPSWGQTTPGVVPEVVAPPKSPTLPQGNDGTVTPSPRSENPQVSGGGARPVPDNGVVTPPSTGTGGSVIRPPASGPMPILPPPGSGGGGTVAK